MNVKLLNQMISFLFINISYLMSAYKTYGPKSEIGFFNVVRFVQNSFMQCLQRVAFCMTFFQLNLYPNLIRTGPILLKYLLFIYLIPKV